MLKLSKTRDCPMKFLQKVKTRFFGEKITLEVTGGDLAWYLQMGWVEKTYGKYLITPYGQQALDHIMITIKEKHGE